MTNAESPITIKKYANRRLYNTASSAYVTLADLAKMVKAGEDFVVYDAKTNDDITRSVLTQIIFEQEGVEGQSLLPIAFLRQVIRFYGDSVQALLPSYLEYSIERFSGEQQKMRESLSRALDPSGYSTASFNALAGFDAQEPRRLQPGARHVLALSRQRLDDVRQGRRRRDQRIARPAHRDEAAARRDFREEVI